MIKRIEAKLIKTLQHVAYCIVTTIGFFLFSVILRLKIYGKENIPKKGRFMLAANHQNFFDGFYLAIALGIHRKITFIIAMRALKSTLFQILMKSIGSVIIGSEIEEYQRAIKKLNNVLTHGGIVGIFPEGDISNKTSPRKFKGGVAKLSLDSKTKVVPIYINGTYNLRNFSYWLKRPQITLIVGNPIELYNYSNVCGNDLDKMASIVREKIIELSCEKLKDSALHIEKKTDSLIEEFKSSISESVKV